jgi:hypothetical protein
MYICVHVQQPLFLSDTIGTLFSRQIFEKYSNIKLHEKQSIGNRVILCGWTDGQTDMTKLIADFRNFSNAPQKVREFNEAELQDF